MRLIKTDKWL